VVTMRRRRALLWGALGALLGVIALSAAASAQAAVRVWISEHTPQTRRLFEEGPDSLRTRFEQEHPNLRLEFVWGSWDTVHSELAFALASGSPPDLVQLPPESLPLLAAHLSPLDTAEWVAGDFLPQALERATWNGRLYGVPLLLDPVTVIYDTVPLIAAGYDARSLPRTWDEYLALVQDVTQVVRSPVAGTAPARLFDHRTWFALFWQAGGELLDGAGGLAVEGEEGAKALRFLRELYGAVAAVEPLIGGGPALASGRVASLFGGVADLRVAFAYNPSKRDFIEVGEPLGDAREAAWLEADFFAIPANSRNPAGAAAALEFLARPENLAAYAETVGYPPARREAFSLAYSLNGSPHYRRLFEVAERYGRAAHLVPRPAVLDALISEAVLNTLENGWEPEAALAHLRQGYAWWVQAGIASSGS